MVDVGDIERELAEVFSGIRDAGQEPDGQSVDGDGDLVIERATAATGFLYPVTVFIDGAEVAQLGNGESRTFLLPAGKHLIEVNGGMMKNKLEVKISPNQTYRCVTYFSALGILGGGLVLKDQT